MLKYSLNFSQQNRKPNVYSAPSVPCPSAFLSPRSVANVGGGTLPIHSKGKVVRCPRERERGERGERERETGEGETMAFFSPSRTCRQNIEEEEEEGYFCPTGAKNRSNGTL